MNKNLLIGQAFAAMNNSYSPYSKFKVGAALLCKNGKVFIGCNIENSSYPAGVCAERTAVSKAVSEGETEFVAMAIVGGKDGNVKDFCTPCGICRQVLSEFCNKDFIIVLSDGKNTKSFELGELLPHSFGKDNLCE